MRIITDIPDEQIPLIKAVCAERGISRAELIRQALLPILQSIQTSPRKNSLTNHPAFGIYKHNSPFGDGVEYQRAIRAEWDDRDAEIEKRLNEIQLK
jgi:hypothetical protein